MLRLCLLLHFLMLLAACLFPAPAWARELDPVLRLSVVRVEVALDPFSLGPRLQEKLASRQSPFATELGRRLRNSSAGTGFFVNADGYLVTNAHVVLSGVRYRGLHLTRNQWDSMKILLGAIRDIWVTVGEGEEARDYLASPVAISEDLDLAVLRICLPPDDKTKFNHLVIAPSSSLQVGDTIRALGFPDDSFEQSDGNVLALIQGSHVHEEMQLIQRTAPGAGGETITVSGTTPGPVVRFQHSAPTGHGSSGGPLLDSKNHVIGVAYALIAEHGSDNDFTKGLNLAIVSNVLKNFLRERAIAFHEARSK